jgi:elongation factor P
MNTENFEQISISEEMIDGYQFMKEGQLVEMMIHADTETPLTCELPAFVELVVTYTEPGFRGDTASNTLKKATLETGAIVQVPLFIEEGTKIRIDTRDNSYFERVK